MPQQNRIVAPGIDQHSVWTANGEVLRPPSDWSLLPPGDAALTRRVKAAGPSWTVQQKRGRKLFSLGVWAATATIESIRAELEVERSQPAYAKRRDADRRRREKTQAEYVGTFQEAVLEFLKFGAQHTDVANRLAAAVTEHATPVGSGTVARTERIPVERRSEAAVIAWMRHQTTAYDNLAIPRIKGKRREVRRLLAEHSRRLLELYRSGKPVDSEICPLQIALRQHKGNAAQ